jgi:fermentation-respiration switch protein FrsA (DUF1100 family)
MRDILQISWGNSFFPGGLLITGAGIKKVIERGEMSGIIGTAVFIVVVMYGSFCLYLFLMQGRMIFYPTRRLITDPGAIGLDYDSVTPVTGDNVKLHGWFIPAPEEKGVLLFFHGNAGNISHRLDSLRMFHDLGLSALIIDYRGYGRSQGSISESGTYLDGEAAWNYLTVERKIPPQRIVVFGRSLGAAIAAYIASRKKPGALIIESAFTSIPEMGARMYPYIPVKLLSRYQYNTRKFLQGVSSPVLVIHSPYDGIIPFENGVQLYESAREPKKFLKIRGDHNEGFLASGRIYTDGIREFITASLSAANQGQ